MLSVHAPPTRTPQQTAARVANCTADREQAYRLRYDVYIAEQGKTYPDADHVNRSLSDELDDDGTILIATAVTGEVVATVRANWFDSPATYACYASLFDIPRFHGVPAAAIAVCSRLAARPDHRHASARARLFDAIYEVGLDRGTRLCFATCARPLLRMFRGYGFREYADPVEDPAVGMLHRTVLALDDLTYLRRIGSPFFPIAQARGLTAPPSIDVNEP